MHNLHLKYIYILIVVHYKHSEQKELGGIQDKQGNILLFMLIIDDYYRCYEKSLQYTKFISKSFNLSMSQVLQLHPLLCPYHVALSVTGSKKKEVFILSQHVAKELREGNLSVLHLPRNSDSMESQYRR